MGTWSVEGDDRTKRLAIRVDGMSPAQVAEGMRAALLSIYAEGGIQADEVTEDDLRAVNIAFHESALAVERATRGRRRYLYWIILPALALNLGAALLNAGHAWGWWSL